LSWEEILADPKDALNHMVVFEENIDRTGLPGDDPTTREKVDNVLRMQNIYTEETLESVKTYGILLNEEVKMLYPSIDFSQASNGLIRLGTIDHAFTDVTADGVIKKISGYLGGSLGTSVDTFHTTWEFKNLTPNKPYTIRYHLYRATNPGLKYWAKSPDATLVSGASFTSTEALANKKPTVWEIKFVPTGTEAKVTVGYDFRDFQKLLLVDMIEIKQVE
jgi:hypothetical protein